MAGSSSDSKNLFNYVASGFPIDVEETIETIRCRKKTLEDILQNFKTVAGKIKNLLPDPSELQMDSSEEEDDAPEDPSKRIKCDPSHATSRGETSILFESDGDDSDHEEFDKPDNPEDIAFYLNLELKPVIDHLTNFIDFYEKKLEKREKTINEVKVGN